MPKYDKETKFYWLQLKEDFFEDDAIEWLEEQKPNGKEYAYFYLKLCLKSLKSNGILIRQVGNILVPYDNKKLAELTKTDFDTVTVAMELLFRIGLIQILENGEIYLTQLENLIGSVSKGALKKQQQRLLKMADEDKSRTEGGHLSTKDKDKDRIKDKIKVKYIDKKTTNLELLKKIISENSFQNIPSRDKLFNTIKEWLEYKQEKNEVYTEIGLKKLLTQIDNNTKQYGDSNMIEIIDTSIASNYKGIIFDKLVGRQPKFERRIF